MKTDPDYIPCDVFRSDYDPFAQKAEYIPDVKEYRLCMTEEQYRMLLTAADGKLDIARHELHDLKSSQSIYQLNGCSDEKYADFVSRAERLVTNWQTIVHAMNEVKKEIKGIRL